MLDKKNITKILSMQNDKSNFEKFYVFLIKVYFENRKNKNDFLDNDLINIVQRNCDSENDIFESKVFALIV